jgi:hypothetical protein
MANLTYTIAKANLNTVDWEGAGKFRLMLVEDGYTPDAADEFVADVTNEASGVGYARVELTGRARSVAGANVEYQADAPNWNPITSAFRYAVVYFDVDGSDGDDATAWLVCALDLGGTQTFVAADFTLDFGGSDPGAVFEID